MPAATASSRRMDLFIVASLWIRMDGECDRCTKRAGACRCRRSPSLLSSPTRQLGFYPVPSQATRAGCGRAPARARLSDCDKIGRCLLTFATAECYYRCEVASACLPVGRRDESLGTFPYRVTRGSAASPLQRLGAGPASDATAADEARNAPCETTGAPPLG